MIALLFYLSTMRTVGKNISMFELEKKLAEYAESLTLDELAVAMMGFFKSSKQLFDESLMNTLIKKLIAELETVKDISFTAVVKVIKKYFIDFSL